QKNMIAAWPLSAVHLLDRVDTYDVLSGQVLAGAIDPADHKQSALPTGELLESKFQPRECVVHDRSVTGMNSAADVAVVDAVIECEYLHACREQPSAPYAAAPQHIIGGNAPACLL